MEAFWLTFKSPELEQKWRLHQQVRRRGNDQNFFIIFGLLVAPNAVKSWRAKDRFLDRSLLPACVIEFFLMALMIRCKPVLYTRHRDTLVALQKTLHFLIVCHLLFVEQEPYDTWAHFIAFDVMHYGKGLYMTINGLLLPLRFRDHFFVQSLQLVISSFYNPRLCRAFLARVPTNGQRYRQVVNVLDYSLNPSLWTGRSGTREIDPMGLASETSACLQTHAFLQTACGFILPSLFIYGTELKLRVAFRARHLHTRCNLARPRWQYPAICGVLYLGLAGLWRWDAWLLRLR